MSPQFLRVAHIDDDLDLLRMVKLVLQVTEDCVVGSFASGEEALLQLPWFEPDLILVDALMPGMSGLDTVLALRERMDLTGIPVVFATGLEDPDGLWELQEAGGAVAVIRKPFDPAELSTQVARARAPRARVEQCASELISIRENFLRRVKSDALAIIGTCELAADDADEGALSEDVASIVHRLSGTAGSLGFEAMGLRARRMAVLAAAIPQAPERKSDLLRELRDEATILLEEASGRPPLESTAIAATKPGSEARPGPAAPRICVVAADADFARDLGRVLHGLGYAAVQVASIGELEPRIVKLNPSAIVLRLDAPGCLAELRRLRNSQNDPVPCIVISQDAEFADYLAAVRAGAEGLYTEPVDVPQMESRLHFLIERGRRDGIRVMLVDDDRDLLAMCAHVLESEGMVVFQVDCPALALAGMARFRPEVLLLDVRMPDCTGPELAQVIRLNPEWMHVPIVYMSQQSDGEDQLMATRKAGEGFVAKPIDPKELVATVCASGRHARQMIETSSRDSLTGLLKHSYIKEHLAAELERAARDGSHVCAVVLDIDNFKSVNDTHGHQVGDLVIRTIATVLRQRLRPFDGIGRLGGEEFLIVLSNCSADHALAIMDEVSLRVAEIEFAGNARHFRVTFSAGIAESAPSTLPADLLAAADKAMYRGKLLGRNRIMCARTTPPDRT